MKSSLDRADAEDMQVLADAGLSSASLLITSLIAGGVVLLSLKTMAVEMDYAQRLGALQQQARALREKQAERMRNLLPKRR